MARQATDAEQLGMDETVIEDEVVEHALTVRQDRKNALASVRKEYNSANDAAKVALERLELPAGKVARVGRFRIEHKVTPARSVSFDTEEKSRLSIRYLKPDEGDA